MLSHPIPTASDGCEANLKRIGQALRQYHNVYGAYPPAVVANENGEPMHSWRVLILPYLDEELLYDQYDFDEPWDGANNSRLLASTPSVYRCPQSHYNQTTYLAIVGAHTAIGEQDSRSVSQIHDPLSTAPLVIDTNITVVRWSEPKDFDTEEPWAGSEIKRMESPHDRMEVRLLYADGIVRDVSSYFPVSWWQEEFHVRDGQWLNK